MKYLLILLVFVAACNTNSKNTEEVAQEEATEQSTANELEVVEASLYGAEINADAAITLDEMMAQLETQDSLFVTVQGEINATCKMKGCWMNISMPDGDEMRVTFKDYGFFVPKEGMEGKQATFEGWVKKSIVTEEDRKHFAKDAGKSEEEIAAITGDEEQLAFVADGVVIE